MQINVGELFIVGFQGTTLPDWLVELAGRFGLGGVILFDYSCQTKTYENNVYSPEQVRELCAKIARLPSRPLIFVDQEGGKVRRLKEKLGFSPLVSQKQFNILSVDEKKAMILKSLRELKDLGFSYNFAPVIDLDINPLNPDIGAVERSYSAKADEVRRNVEILHWAASEVGIGLSLKHYPGLGGATTNSHSDLTDLSDSLRDDQLDLFYTLAGHVSGTSVVVSHGIVTQWEPKVPVSMSSVALRRLREKAPDVLAISDDLQMQGLQKIFSTEAACERGLQAGLDMLCIGNNLMNEEKALLGVAEHLAHRMETNPELRRHALGSLERVHQRKRAFSRG